MFTATFRLTTKGTCVSMATVVAQMCHSVTVYVHCLACLLCLWHISVVTDHPPGDCLSTLVKNVQGYYISRISVKI
jgi:hypothetical protein